MSFHGKMQQLKSGQADKEIQLWAYEQIEKEPKELTDEEILEIADAGEWHKDEFAINFARAILRKAQEKCNGFCGEYECKENQAGCKRKAQEK